VESRQKYLPFGELLDQTGIYTSSKGYTNHEQTDPSGMIYMQARFYIPWMGRFTSPDPARDQHFEDTQSWNIYSYVRNSPILSTDPTGMVDEDKDKNQEKQTGVQGNALTNAMTVTQDLTYLVANTANKAAAERAKTNAAVIGSVGAVATRSLVAQFGSWLMGALNTAGTAVAPYVAALLMVSDTSPAALAQQKAKEANADAAKKDGTKEGSDETGKTTKEVKERKTPGRDGGKSEHIIEKEDGQTISKTHRVTKDGEIVHQHQDHVGKSGTVRRFPDEWTGTKTK
jgi:RHS repeat-associated protein